MLWDEGFRELIYIGIIVGKLKIGLNKQLVVNIVAWNLKVA